MIEQLIKGQDKALTSVRSYFANLNLIHKLAHILYQWGGTLLLLMLLLMLALHHFSTSREGSNYQSISHTE